MSYLERPGCTCRAAGDPAAYMHDDGCPARSNDPVWVMVLAADPPARVISGPPTLSGFARNEIRGERVSAEIRRLGADVVVGWADRGVLLVPVDERARLVDGLAALGLLIELPDGAGTQAAWSALLTLPEIT